MDHTEQPDQPASPDWNAELAAATAWWFEAGVDCGFVDQPQNWLAAAKAPVAGENPHAPDGRAARTQGLLSPPAAQPAAPPAAPPAPGIGGERSGWPATLADFGGWWLTEPSLDVGSSARRVLPCGPQHAALMVLVGEPEVEDGEALLSGAQGRLLDAMLAAFGLSRDDAYLASILPRHTPLADWAGLAREGMGAIVAHHVALAVPERLLVFGQGGVSALVGHDPAQGAPTQRFFNHEGGSVPLLVAPELGTLLGRPAHKARLWTRWLEWTDPG